MDLIKKSAVSASARLQFCRLAFGAAGSLAASIDTGDAENVARGLIANERTTLDWKAPRQLLPKNNVKLVLNLCLIGAGCHPARRRPYRRHRGRGRRAGDAGRGQGRERAASACGGADLLRRGESRRSTPIRSSPITRRCWPISAG